MSIMGATRDDAAGECFDKIARVLGLPYPGGKPMDDLAQGGDPHKYRLPRAKLDHDFCRRGIRCLNLQIRVSIQSRIPPDAG